MLSPEMAQARILVVDDEIIHMEALCDALNGRGYQATGCSSGNEALAALQQTTFDLLLADLTMPEMDGIALLQSARLIDPNLATIVMSGQSSTETAVQATKAGAIDYIVKPFRLASVLPVISRALAIRQQKIKTQQPGIEPKP